MKLCIIGNSHVAALKLAWDAQVYAQYPNLKITFFAAPNPLLEHLIVQDGILTSHNHETRKSFALTTGIKPEINPQDHDQFLIYGFGTDIRDMLDFEKDWFSTAVEQAALIDFWHRKPMLGILQKLQQITDKPIFAGLQPLAAVAEEKNQALQAYADFVDWNNNTLFAGLNTPLIAQPARTMTPDATTPHKFLQGAPRLPLDLKRKGAFYKKVDKSHMNADYGAIWLRAFFEQYLAPNLTKTSR